MALNVVQVASRAAMQGDAEADFQTWSGLASDGNPLFFGSRWSEGKRTVCGIARQELFRRKTSGTSYPGHFRTPGETVIETDTAGLFLTLKFDPRVRGLGLDLEPSGPTIVPGRLFRVKLTLWSSIARDMVVIEKNGQDGTAVWLGVRSNGAIPDIERAIFEIHLLDTAQAVTKFAFDRLELIVPPFSPAPPPLVG